MSENESFLSKIDPIEVAKWVGIAEACLLGYTGYQAFTLEAPKYVNATTGVATTDKTLALKAGTGGTTGVKPTYEVSNTVLTNVQSKGNLDTKLAANQLTNLLCKTQAGWFYPLVGMVANLEDCDYAAHVTG